MKSEMPTVEWFLAEQKPKILTSGWWKKMAPGKQWEKYNIIADAPVRLATRGNLFPDTLNIMFIQLRHS